MIKVKNHVSNLADNIYSATDGAERSDIVTALIYNIMQEIMDEDDPRTAIKLAVTQMTEIYKGAMVEKKAGMH
jgi:hypothetical protein